MIILESRSHFIEFLFFLFIDNEELYIYDLNESTTQKLTTKI